MAVSSVESDLRRLISSAIESAESETPRTRDVAEAIAAELDPDRLRKFAVIGLADEVRKFLAEHRRQDRNYGSSSRWGEVKQAQAKGTLDLDRISVNTGKETKWLLECTAADLKRAADEHFKLSLSHERTADRLAKLSRVLKKAGASKVADLPEEEVQATLNA